MKFDALHEYIPYARYGKLHSLHANIYPGVDIALPGRHAEDTSPRGGDYVVLIDDDVKKWVKHPFTHTDIFKDIEKTKMSMSEDFRWAYYNVVSNGVDPGTYDFTRKDCPNGIHPMTFLYAVQALAVAEHRRYAQHEPRFGGRFLPFRFAAGIIEGLWSATDAAEKQKRGRPGVEWLEKDHGVPELTKALMNRD